MTHISISKFRAIFASIALVATFFTAQAQNVLADDNGVAVGGFDVTTYFNNAPTTGNPSFTAIYDGAIYRFVSATNRDLFKANPAKFAPQCGGYCAFAIGKMNAKVPINPTTYKITDGKLYLFFNDLYEGKPLNTLELWNGDEKGLLPVTNANWAKMTVKK